MRHLRSSLLSCALLACACGAEEQVPLGSPKFYPSPERTLGYRGDGTGCFPGATPVAEWWEGTPQINPGLKTDDGVRGKPKWVPADAQRRNIVWKTPMPGWSDSQPVVVGDRIVTICEPDLVLCVDAHRGGILWQDRLTAASCEIADPQKAAQRQELIDIGRASTLVAQRAFSRVKGIDRPALARHDLPLMRAWQQRAQELDPDPVVQKAFATAIALLERVAGGAVEGIDPGDAVKSMKVLRNEIGKRCKMTMASAWEGYVGLAVCPPVTDGTHIYVIFGQGQVGCYDLNGKRIWAQRLDSFSGNVHASHWPAPLLCGDTLIVRGGYDGMWLVGFDKKDGQQRWRTQISQTPNWNHGAYAGHALMKLPLPAGETLDLVITNRGTAVRAADGKLMAEQPAYLDGSFKGRNGHGVSKVVWKDLYLSSESGDGPSSPAAVMRVTAVDRDQIRIAQVAELEPLQAGRGPLQNQPVVVGGDGVVHYAGNTWDLATGKLLGSVQGKVLQYNGGSWAGNRLIFNPNDNDGGRSDQHGGKLCLATFAVLDLADPAKPSLLSSNNLLGSEEYPGDHYLEQILKLDGQDKLPNMYCYGGISYWFGCRNGGPFPSGNRLFIQSACALYCIGDPAVTYDWDPASRPAEITAMLRR